MHILSRNGYIKKDIIVSLNAYILWQKMKKIDKYMAILENFSNIIKKVNNEFIYNKKYLRAKKIFNRKESFQCFYWPVILFDFSL